MLGLSGFPQMRLQAVITCGSYGPIMLNKQTTRAKQLLFFHNLESWITIILIGWYRESCVKRSRNTSQFCLNPLLKILHQAKIYLIKWVKLTLINLRQAHIPRYPSNLVHHFIWINLVCDMTSTALPKVNITKYGLFVDECSKVASFIKVKYFTTETLIYSNDLAWTVCRSK